MSDQRLLLEYLSNRRAGEEIVFSEIRSVLEWSDDAIVGMMEDMGLGSWFSHHKTRMSVKDHSILEALCGSQDEKEDRPSGGAGSGVVDAKHRQSGAARSSASSADADSKHFIEEHFSAVYKGKARRIAEIKDTRMHQRVEQAFVEWQDGSTAWVGIQDLSSEAQQHVRLRIHGTLDSDSEQEQSGEENVLSNRKTRKRRRKALGRVGQSGSYQKRREERKKRDKKKQKKESEELNAQISAMLGDADDARRLMEFIIKRWGDDAKTDAAAAEHFPPIPSDETLAARVNEFLEFTSISANSNVVCAVCAFQKTTTQIGCPALASSAPAWYATMTT